MPTKTPKAKDAETRHMNKLDRLGSEHPCCRACGKTDPRVLELHHMPGKRFGDDLVILCRNCHAILSDDQREHPEPTAANPSFEERLGHFLLGLGDFFALIAERLAGFGLELIARVTGPATDSGRVA